MGKNRDQANFIDDIAGFAMRHASRRGFIKWLGKGGLALAASMTAGIEFLSGTASASVNCSMFLRGCQGFCSCVESECTDPDNGQTQVCTGFCGACVTYRYYAYIYWYWDSRQNKCVQSKNCIAC